MPIVIQEVTTEAIKPVAPAQTGEPVKHMPSADADSHIETIAAIRRAEARRERLRAD